MAAMLFKDGTGSVPNFTEAKRRLTTALVDYHKLFKKLFFSELMNANQKPGSSSKGIISTSLGYGVIKFFANATVPLRLTFSCKGLALCRSDYLA
jgi:hypothetical protein